MQSQKNEERTFVHEKGVTYFSRQTERRVLFVLTMVMLIWGVVDYASELF